jgi:predicted transcriptional regulator
MLRMIELSPLRKNKITLTDYDYRRDIENRLLMAQFTTLDLEVLEEILYSSLHVPIRKLAKHLDLDEATLHPILEKFSKTGLLKIENDSVIIDKEMRKYYEAQIVKFEDDFTPGMEFLQSLLKKVPIHVLPTWYSIPRTSNNIFDSLVEKYLLTPHLYQRYLLELNFGDPVLSGIIDDLIRAPDFKLSSKQLIEKYGLTREQFEEYLLYLEFNFVCCLGYQRENGHWKEIITPFEEWREYLRFLKETEAPSIPAATAIQRTWPSDFAFIQDMAIVLTLAKKDPLPLVAFSPDKPILEPSALAAIASKMEGMKAEDPQFQSKVQHILAKLFLLKLADRVDNRLYALEAANDWLDMRPENRALFIYRHPLNRLLNDAIPTHLCTERNIREAEKAILRVLNKGWVFYDDFIKGVLVTLNDDSVIILKRTGKTWKYTLPRYTEESLALIKATLFEWLFEAGIVATGNADGKECFTVTAFGQSLFGR